MKKTLELLRALRATALKCAATVFYMKVNLHCPFLYFPFQLNMFTIKRKTILAILMVGTALMITLSSAMPAEDIKNCGKSVIGNISRLNCSKLQ